MIKIASSEKMQEEIAKIFISTFPEWIKSGIILVVQS